MNQTTKRLLADALALPDRERADLAAELIETLDPAVDAAAPAAWDAEVFRRVSEIDSGKVACVPWPEARRMIMGHPNDPSGS